MKNNEIQKLQRQGFGYKKIARILGISENTAKSYCKRHPIDKSKKLCIECGQEISSTPHKREKKFCSDKCRMVWWNSHPELVNRKAIYTFVCLCCGTSFESYGNDHRKYCSRTCYAKARQREVNIHG